VRGAVTLAGDQFGLVPLLCSISPIAHDSHDLIGQFVTTLALRHPPLPIAYYFSKRTPPWRRHGQSSTITTRHQSRTSMRPRTHSFAPTTADARAGAPSFPSSYSTRTCVIMSALCGLTNGRSRHVVLRCTHNGPTGVMPDWLFA